MDRYFWFLMIPRSVYFDERLDGLAKLLWAELDSTCSPHNGDFSDIDSLAKFFKESPSRIMKSIDQLVEAGLVNVLKQGKQEIYYPLQPVRRDDE